MASEINEEREKTKKCFLTWTRRLHASRNHKKIRGFYRHLWMCPHFATEPCLPAHCCQERPSRDLVRLQRSRCSPLSSAATTKPPRACRETSCRGSLVGSPLPSMVSAGSSCSAAELRCDSSRPVPAAPRAGGRVSNAAAGGGCRIGATVSRRSTTTP